MAGLAAGCERLVHPSARGAERARQNRLLGLLLAGPFVLSAAVVQTFTTVHGAAPALAALCAVFAASWLLGFFIVSRGRTREVEIVALGGASILFATLIAASGNVASPLFVLVAALPAEAWWVARSRRAAMTGVAAAVGTLALAAIVGDASVAVSPWLWLSPLAYAASLAIRVAGESRAVSAGVAGEGFSLPDDCLDAVIVRLNHTGEVEGVSARAAATFGVEPALLLGSGLFERIHVADRVEFLCAAARARDEGVCVRCDLRIRMPVTAEGEGGGYRPFEAEFVRPTAQGPAVAVIRDGEDRAALRRKLAVTIEQAGATEVAKGRFLAAVSHELRTPLNAIIGFSDMLLHPQISGALAPRQEEHVTLIREAGGHLLSVVNAILDVSKIESGSYEITVEPFELQAAADLCCAMLAPQAADKGVTLSMKLPSGLGLIAGDQRAVQQILINLVSNAVKFTPQGGHVTVTAAQAEGTVRIFVNDTGIGIRAEDLARLGRPFMQVQNDYTRQFEGTGLGLSLVKGLVKLHGGTMSMESAPGLGTTVTIGLPAARMAAGDEAEATGVTGERHGIALRKIA